MYKKILVPLDGSGRAERILPHVEELALNYDAQVLFLGVVEPVYVYTSTFSPTALQDISTEALREQTESYLAGLTDKYREKNIKTKAFIEEGSVSHKIMEVAEREEIDLIAMSSHGRSGLARVFYGSVAASLLQQVDRPLLLVRADGSE